MHCSVIITDIRTTNHQQSEPITTVISRPDLVSPSPTTNRPPTTSRERRARSLSGASPAPQLSLALDQATLHDNHLVLVSYYYHSPTLHQLWSPPGSWGLCGVQWGVRGEEEISSASSCSHLKLSSSHFPLNYKREKLIPLKREESLPLKVWPLVSTRHQLILRFQRKIPKQGLVTKPKTPLSRNELKLQSEYKVEEYCSHRKKAKYHPIIPNGFLRNML